MEAALWVIAVTYAVPVFFWWHAWRRLRRLNLEALRAPQRSTWSLEAPPPSLAVIVPCHNEERGVESCVHKLLAQDYPNLRIIIANDRSTDSTGRIVADLAAHDDRIAVVEISELPAGWTGKTHVLSRAVKTCSSEYVLFLDSDVDLSPHALLSVMDKVCRDDIDFLTLWPNVVLRSFSEKLLTPPCMTLLGVWALPRRVDRDVAEECILGNGQFLLVRRASYEALGGHAGVAAELAEDAVLAAKAHERGQRCWAGLGGGST